MAMCFNSLAPFTDVLLNIFAHLFQPVLRTTTQLRPNCLIASDNASFEESHPIDNGMLFLYEEASCMVISKPSDWRLHPVGPACYDRNRIV